MNKEYFFIVFYNVISNVIKYGYFIKLEIYISLEEKYVNIFINIKDNGGGIFKEY